jgi:hypothetical protein
MQRIPVDLSRCLVLCTEVPTPKVRDGRQRTDARSGLPLWSVGVCVIQERTSDVVAVTVAGEPSGLMPGRPVLVVGLTAIPWEQSDDGRSRHGVAFRAESITVDGGPARPAGGKAAG